MPGCMLNLGFTFFFAKLIPKLNLDDFIITVTADHSTVCVLKAHTADPVPILFCGGKIISDKKTAFSETEAKTGSIGQILGRQIMGLLSKFASE